MRSRSLAAYLLAVAVAGLFSLSSSLAQDVATDDVVVTGAPQTNVLGSTLSRLVSRAVPDSSEPIDGVADEWLTKIAAGGRTVLILFFCSVVGLAFALERLVMLRRGAIVPRGLMEKVASLWRQNQFDEILALCRKRSSTLARILAFIVTHRRASMDDLSTAVGDIGARELKRHLLRAYPLAVVATLSPLLGLLGTVIGMIEAFDTVVLVGMGDATALAGGISKALITTMVGLCIAVPSLFAYHLFKNRTNLYAVMLEEEVTEFISTFLMEAETDHAH